MGSQALTPRKFGFVLAAAVAAAGMSRGARWPLAASALVLAAAVVRPAMLAPLQRLSAAGTRLAARGLGEAAAAVLFFLVLTPAGLLSRLLRRDPLRLAWNEPLPTYWIDREPPGPEPESMARQY